MHIRRAGVTDAEALASVLNAVVSEGGKTAIGAPLTVSEFAEWFITGPHCLSCLVAVSADGELLGYQALERFHRDLPPGVADIGTFVTASSRGSGVGRGLADATANAAEEAGLRGLRAVVRRSNDDAVGYYRAIGFREEGNGSVDGPVVLMRYLAPTGARTQ